MKLSIGKFIPLIFLFAAILIGSIILIKKNNSTHVALKRDYFLAMAEGDGVYKFPLPFTPGTQVGEIVKLLSTNYNKVFRRQGTRLILLDPQQQIYSDIQIKIT